MRKLNLLIQQFNAGRISRRQFIVRASALGLSLPLIGGILAACETTDDDDDDVAVTDDTAEPTPTVPGEVTATPAPENGVTGQITWVSPRGTLEVLDDYAYWVAESYGWFGDIETIMEPGPMEATSTARLVDQGQADVGFPSPGVYTLSLEAGVGVTSVYQMGALDVFAFAFQPGSGIESLEDLVGREIALGDPGWESIANPLFAQAGIDPSEVNYVEAGEGWAQSLAQGQADAALTWEGLRAQWEGQGLEFDYLLGKDFSAFPANSFVIRTEEVDDEELRPLYEQYFRGWSMGLEFGYLNPRAATQHTMDQFPALAEQMEPEIAVESMMQLANCYRGDFDARDGWGWHDPESWEIFLETIAELGQVSEVFDTDVILSNDFIAAANDFDHDEVQQAADEFELRPEYEEVDVEAIRARL